MRDLTVEADVRAAKARGIVRADWPAGKPLSLEADIALQRARERDRRTAMRLGPHSGAVGARSGQDSLSGRPEADGPPPLFDV